MDLREAHHVLLECHRHSIEVHPRDARLSIACEGDSIGVWSNPAQMIDAWVCDEHTPFGGGRWDIVLVENRAVAELSATCCEYDVCDRGYDGYRFRD